MDIWMDWQTDGRMAQFTSLHCLHSSLWSTERNPLLIWPSFTSTSTSSSLLRLQLHFARFWKIKWSWKMELLPLLSCFTSPSSFLSLSHPPSALLPPPWLPVFMWSDGCRVTSPRKHLFHLPHAMICAGHRFLAPPCRHVQCKTHYIFLLQYKWCCGFPVLLKSLESTELAPWYICMTCCSWSRSVESIVRFSYRFNKVKMATTAALCLHLHKL